MLMRTHPAKIPNHLISTARFIYWPGFFSKQQRSGNNFLHPQCRCLRFRFHYVKVLSGETNRVILQYGT